MSAPKHRVIPLLLRPLLLRPLTLRAAWVATAVGCLAALFVSLPGRIQHLAVVSDPDVRAGLARLRISPQAYMGYHIGFDTLTVAGYFLVALIIVLRRRGDAMAGFVALVLIAFGCALPSVVYALAASVPLWDAPPGPVQSVGWLLLLVFAYVFPDGRFVPRWTSLLALGAAAWTGGFFVFGDTLFSGRPLAIAAALAVWVGWFATGAAAQFYRYLFVESPMQRQQTKLVVLGFAGTLFGVLVAVAAHVAALAGVSAPADAALLRLASTAVFSLSALLLPIAIALAMLRYRLFDVDIVINRAIVYGTVTGLLALVYTGCVGLLNLALGIVVARAPSVAIVAATLATAALFQPLRGRVQARVDQRFDRGRYDARRTLEAFGAVARERVDLSDLAGDLVSVVDQTMRPSHVSLWLRPSGASPEPEGAGVAAVTAPDARAES